MKQKVKHRKYKRSEYKIIENYYFNILQQISQRLKIISQFFLVFSIIFLTKARFVISRFNEEKI